MKIPDDPKYLKSDLDHETNTDNSYIFIALAIIGLILFLWLLPILIIMSSSKTTSGEKIAWILAVLFITWFAWIFYMLLAPIKKRNN